MSGGDGDDDSGDGVGDSQFRKRRDSKKVSVSAPSDIFT